MRAFSSEVHRPFILARHAVKMTDTYTERVTQRMNTSYRHRASAAVSLTIALIGVLVALMTAPRAIMARVGADPVRPMEAPVSLTDGFSDLGTPSDGDEEDDEDDDPDISEYDQMPPNRIWREAIGLEAIQDEYVRRQVSPDELQQILDDRRIIEAARRRMHRELGFEEMAPGVRPRRNSV